MWRKGLQLDILDIYNKVYMSCNLEIIPKWFFGILPPPPFFLSVSWLLISTCIIMHFFLLLAYFVALLLTSKLVHLFLVFHLNLSV